MMRHELARERVIAAALTVAAGRAARESREPSAHDDAQAEYEMDHLSETLINWHKINYEEE